MKKIMKMLALLVGLLIMTAIPAWASQGVGSSPYAADLLVSGLNTGQLDPGQEYWYAYSRLDLGDVSYNSVVLSLNFEAEGRAIASRVNFQVFAFDQVDAWLKDSSGPVDSLGLGTAASADFDVNTGERLWAGAVASNDVYYVRIFNLSPSPVQFRLTALGQKNSQSDGFLAYENTSADRPGVIPAAISAPANTVASAETAALPAAPPLRSTIADSLPVQPNDGSPTSTRWLLAAQAINGLPPQEAAAWLMSAAALGWLPGGSATSSSLLPVDPNAEVSFVPVDKGDQAGSGAAAVPVEPDPNIGTSIYPNQPLTLFEGRNTGRIGPNNEYWYTFTPGKVDGKLIEDLKLTMFFTPGEPNLARHVTFELFTGSQYQIWERGTPDDMEHFGAGSWVSRDGDYITGERLWNGTVVDGDKYFIKITNDTSQWIDYYLFTDDIINTELGTYSELTKSTAKIVDHVPSGSDIGSPLTLHGGRKSGHLPAGEDIWFSFENISPDSDQFEFENYVISLEHSPGAGYVTNHVNVEIYPFQEQQIWRRGDTDLIKPLGAGSDFAYDEDSDAHTWIWDGHLVSNTIYFIRVRNGSVRDIDYKLTIQQRS